MSAKILGVLTYWTVYITTFSSPWWVGLPSRKHHFSFENMLLITVIKPMREAVTIKRLAHASLYAGAICTCDVPAVGQSEWGIESDSPACWHGSELFWFVSSQVPMELKNGKGRVHDPGRVTMANGPRKTSTFSCVWGSSRNQKPLFNDMDTNGTVDTKFTAGQESSP